MTITQKFIKKNSVEVLSPFLGWCILNDLFFGAGHMADAKTGHAVYAKTGYTVDVYAPKGFIKVLMRNVEG